MNTTSLIPDQVYHVYSHATGDDNFFRSDENYRYFLERYQKHILPIADTYAYCLMPNHFHFMIRIRGEEELMKHFKNRKSVQKPTRFTKVNSSNKVNITGSGKTFNSENLVGLISRQFSNFFNAYSKAFNKMYARHGALFRERFRRKHVDNDSYFTGLIAYIHHNPVHHGFVKQLSDWSWSSWHAYAGQKTTKVQVSEVLGWFGDMKNMISFHTGYQQMERDYQLFEDE